MKNYESIPHWNKGHFGEKVWGFNKLDGTMLRAEWAKKRGWYKFGTKGMMIDASHDEYGEAVRLFEERYGETLPKIFTDSYRQIENFVAFFEFFGPNSFAGLHLKEPHEVVLFDLSAYKKGLLPPKEFIQNFDSVPLPQLLYIGNYNKQLIQDVMNGEYAVSEGLVCKGVKKNRVWMVKIKTNAWLEKLKERKGIEAVFKELNSDAELAKEYRC